MQNHTSVAKKPARNLTDALQRAEEERHAARQRELRSMGDKLALLDPLVPALKERGFDLHYLARHIEWAGSNKALYISSLSVFGGNKRLYEALTALGFKEVQRGEGRWALVVLAKGRCLRISFGIDTAGEYAVPAPGSTA